MDQATPSKKFKKNKQKSDSSENSNSSKLDESKSPVTPKRKKNQNKGRKELDISMETEVNGSADASATSTPKDVKKDKIKPIIKHTPSVDEDSIDYTNPENYTYKSKKRNKSVSFVLDDETQVKKVKSEKMEISPEKNNGSKSPSTNLDKEKKRKNKNKNKENKVVTNDGDTMNSDIAEVTENSASTDMDQKVPGNEKKRKSKKPKKDKVILQDQTQINDITTNVNQQKPKKRRKNKSSNSESNTEDEPRNKKEKEPEISEELKNLSIGDNAHSLTNLLDEMKVVDSNKKKGKKNKSNKKKPDQSEKTSESSSAENAEEKKAAKERTLHKLKKKKDRKLGRDVDRLTLSVIVENIPRSIIDDYKIKLKEHFSDCGTIKHIGVAELYPKENPGPVFTTTVFFSSESEATKALEQDNSMLEDEQIRVKRPLPPTQTTAVIISYGPLTQQYVSETFGSAGRIRSVNIIKNRKSTAFVEFDGPQTLEKALKMGEGLKVGGKNVNIKRFEYKQGSSEASKSSSVTATTSSSQETDNE